MSDTPYDEVPADFAFDEDADLKSIEQGMRAVESNIKFGMAILAVSLGRIKREQLYYDVAPDFKNYLRLERTDLSYQKAIHLSEIGIKYWEFQAEFRQQDLRLSQCMSKMRLLDRTIVDNDPMFWERFKILSVRELKSYTEKRKANMNVYTSSSMTETIRVSDASLYLGNQKIKGINLKEAREQTAAGKRALVLWIENDNEARRIRRLLEKNL